MLSISTITNAQIKIHTGGNVSLGSTTAPPSGFKLQLIFCSPQKLHLLLESKTAKKVMKKK